MVSPDRPSLAELRAKVHKRQPPVDRQYPGPAVRAAGGGLRDLAGGSPSGSRRTRSRPGRWWPRSPLRGGSARAVAGGSSPGWCLAWLAFWLDHVDGQVARWRGTSSLDGVYFDYLLHHVANLTLGFALGFGLAERLGDPLWAVAGALIALGWATLSLHNDCRYKAFFQRLKSPPARSGSKAGRGVGPVLPRAGLVEGWGC